MNKKSKITLFILALITIVLIVLLAFAGNADSRVNGIYKFVGTPAASVQRTFTKIGNSLNNWFKLVTSYDEIEEEMNTLKEENSRLREYEDECVKLTAENEELREMISLKDSSEDYELVAANVIAGDVTDWFNYFMLDCGTDDGVEKNCPVITSDGLVGIVSEAGPSSAKVVTVVDEQNVLMCRLVRSNELVRLRGVSSENLKYEMYVDRIADGSEMFVGDEIVTAASGGIFPEGISVGRVAEIIIDAESGERSARIDISVDLKVLS